MKKSYEMSVTWKLKYFCFTLVTLNPVNVEAESIAESSGEYLQKVMIELQELNVPSTALYDQLSSNTGYNNIVYEENGEPSDTMRRTNLQTRQNVQKYRNQGIQHYSITPTNRGNSQKANTEILSQYQQTQVPSITKMREPESLGLTRAELATMYKTALEKGSAIRLSSLTNALTSGDMPQVTDTHVEFPVKQPLYRYYFFPLKTFMSEFKKDHGYKTIPTSTLDAETTQNTETKLSNPLFVAISTFITMAIIFMMGVMFLPKFTRYDLIHARGIQDGSYYLSNTVINAINRYNLLETLRTHHLDHNRYVTGKGKRRRARGLVTIVNKNISSVVYK